MSYYLLKWNPTEWPAAKLGEYFDQFERGETLRWACGRTKKIIPGDRFFLIKNGNDGRGIIGSGLILSAPFEDAHYDDEKARNGKEALFVEVKFEYLAKPGAALPVGRHELDAPGLASKVWDVQGSGKTIPDDVAEALTALWASRVEIRDFASPDEVDPSAESLPEGAKKRVTVNAYERNPEARRRCLNRWGYNCSVCQFRFDSRMDRSERTTCTFTTCDQFPLSERHTKLIRLWTLGRYAQTVMPCSIASRRR